MAERKSQNKYYPPDWDPSKGSINHYVKRKAIVSSHSKKTKKLPSLGSGVRFEMPFSIWCLGCHNHIGQGVRYNAKKHHIDDYYSTPIYRFLMKCHLCPNWIEIHTDPKNAAYVIINGARKREEEYDPKAIGLIDLPDEKEKERLEQDPFYRLEHNLEDETKAKETFLSLEQMQKYNNEHWKDPYTANQILRNGFRAEKKHQKRLQIEANEVKDRLDLSIPILPASEEDTIQAQKIDWKEYTIDSGRAPKQASVQGQAIFASKKSAAITPKERLKQLLQRKRSDPFAVFSK